MWFMIWWLDSYLGCIYTRYIIMSLISLDLHSLFQLFVDFRESLLASPDLKSSVCSEELSGFNSVVEEPTDTNTH